MKRGVIETGDICHVYNRGVEKRTIFLDDSDYLRFIHDLFEFNDVAPAGDLYQCFHSRNPQCREVQLPDIGKRERKPRKLLVDVLAFCLMPNHVHLMLRQRVSGGIAEFMRKIGTGFTNFFNKRYERTGHLFQGRYKFVRILRHEQLLYVPYYIHANPLGLAFPEWRTRTVLDWRRAVKFLESYRWSSLKDYMGKKNFPSVTQREFLVSLLGDSAAHRRDMRQWIADRGIGEGDVEDVTLE